MNKYLLTYKYCDKNGEYIHTDLVDVIKLKEFLNKIFDNTTQYELINVSLESVSEE